MQQLDNGRKGQLVSGEWLQVHRSFTIQPADTSVGENTQIPRGTILLGISWECCFGHSLYGHVARVFGPQVEELGKCAKSIASKEEALERAENSSGGECYTKGLQF